MWKVFVFCWQNGLMNEQLTVLDSKIIQSKVWLRAVGLFFAVCAIGQVSSTFAQEVEAQAVAPATTNNETERPRTSVLEGKLDEYWQIHSEQVDSSEVVTGDRLRRENPGKATEAIELKPGVNRADFQQPAGVHPIVQTAAAQAPENGATRVNIQDQNENASGMTAPATSPSAPAAPQTLPSLENKPATNPDGLLSVESIESRKQQIASNTEMDAATKDALIKIYDNILAEIKTRTDNQRNAEECSAKAEAAPATIAEAKRRKENTPKFEPISQFTLKFSRQDKLQSLLQQQQTALQQASDTKSTIDEKLKTREVFKKDYSRLVSEQKDIQTKLSEELAAKATSEIDPQIGQAKNLLVRAKLSASVERVRMLEQRQRMYDAETELLPLQRELLAVDEANYQRQIKEINAELSSRRETYVESFREFAMEKLEREPTAEDRAVAERMIKRADDWLEITRTNRTIQAQEEEFEKQRENWESRFANLRTRIESNSSNGFGGLNSWVGLMLRRQRKELPDIRVLRDELGDYQSKMQETGSLLLELEDWLSQHSSVVLNESDLNELVVKEKEMMKDFHLDAKAYFESLTEVSDQKQQMILLIHKYRDFVDQHILWIRSTDPIEKSHFAQLWPAFTWLFNVQAWKNVVTTFLEEIELHLIQAFLFLLAWGVLIYNSVELRRRIKQLGDQADRANNTRFMPTTKVVMLTLLVSLPWPALMYYVAHRLQSASGADPFVQQFGNGLYYASLFFFFLEVLRQVCRSGGLAEKHLQWPTAATALVRKNLRWFLDIATTFVLIGVMVFDRADEIWVNSLGRIAFAILMILFTVVLASLLNPKHGVLKEYINRHSGGWVDRLRYVWVAAVVAAPLLLMTASLFGYHYTAVRLATLLFRTTITLLGILILYGLATRWLLLSRRQLAIAQARQRLEEAQRESTIAASGNAVIHDVRSTEFRNEIRNEQKAIDLATINAQTRSLVSACAVVASLLFVVWIWSDVLPAVSALESVKLWPIEGGTSSAASGAEHLAAPASSIVSVDVAESNNVNIQPKQWITLSDLLFAIPIAVLTVFAARNFPGLLEIALLQHLPIENAVRYAITTVSRYALLMIGIAMTFNYIGMRWSSIQWLVAALGVGLGFGLQEIFANFVSGLILLFEQPIRVGDVITIGETTGAVAKIRMRATTITNWDRQELIVPNKDLITGRLLNWTLSDSTNRLVLTFVIEFGSDTQKACQILLNICKNHPNVLNDPAPSAFFENIRENGLELVLRFFLQTLDMRLQTKHDLLTSIYASFDEEGIRISRPQRELHLNTMPENLTDWIAGKNSKRIAS
jgi:potassium efflux system protein